jgi:hypothetical protein
MSGPTHLVSAPTVYQPCEECGAALDPQQRYCVNCAARRPSGGANPSSRYFASMSKRARRPLARPPARQPSGSRAAAVGFFALLPIAVAIGVVVGRADSGNGDEGALLQALREQGRGSIAASPGATAATGSGAGGAAKKEAAKNAKQQKKSGKPQEKVAAKTHNGTVHQITGYNPSPKKIEETTKLVEENVNQTGAGYIKSQQGLPDVIPVGGNPDEAPPLPTGKGE